MNKSRLRQLAAHLRLPQTADHFSMNEYLSPGLDDYDFDEEALTTPAKTLEQCGSYGCIAGHAVLLADPNGPTGEIYSRAREWLELDPEQAFTLFRPDEDVFDWDRITNLIAADVIDQLVKTGEVRWPDEVELSDEDWGCVAPVWAEEAHPKEARLL
jgi:hypothetical protein